MNLGTLLHGSSRPASTAGRTIGTPRRYDFITAALFAGRRRRAFRELAAAAGIRPGDRVLDVGCGTGYLVRMLAEIVGPDGSVVGVDAAPEMVAYAASRSRSAANASFEVGSAGALSFPDSTFDAVLSSLTMHHLAPAEQLPAVREMRRVLKPGGRLLIAEFQAPHGHGWRLLLGPTGLAAMAHAVPHIEAQVAEVGFTEIQLGEVAPVLRYVRAVNGPG
ncbi:MAG: class I SAM-dependent methyltransferase [Nitrosotalea sp.]